MLQHLRDEDEEDDDDRREGLSDGECRDERNGHRQLHRHAALTKGLERLLVDGVAAHQRRSQRYRVDLEERLPREEPRDRDRHRDEPDANEVVSLDVVLVALLVLLSGAVRWLGPGDGTRGIGHGPERLDDRFHDDPYFTYARTISISSSAARARLDDTFSSGSRTW